MVAEDTDVRLTDEFENIKKWACDNKMIINLSKTQGIVFHRINPRPSSPSRHSLYPDPLAYLDQVYETKLLGVTFNDRSTFNSRAQYNTYCVNDSTFVANEVAAQAGSSN